MTYTGNYISSLLYYNYSSVLNERINLGLLMIFPDTNQVFFKYHNSFERITYCYPRMKHKISIVRSTVKSIQNLVIKLNNKNDLGINSYSDPAYWVNDKILLKDATVLQFSNPSKGVMYNENANKVFSDMYEIYFGHLTP